MCPLAIQTFFWRHGSWGKGSPALWTSTELYLLPHLELRKCKARMSHSAVAHTVMLALGKAEAEGHEVSLSYTSSKLAWPTQENLAQKPRSKQARKVRVVLGSLAWCDSEIERLKARISGAQIHSWPPKFKTSLAYKRPSRKTKQGWQNVKVLAPKPDGLSLILRNHVFEKEPSPTHCPLTST